MGVQRKTIEASIEEAWEALLHVRRFAREMKSDPPDSEHGGSDKFTNRKAEI